MYGPRRLEPSHLRQISFPFVMDFIAAKTGGEPTMPIVNISFYNGKIVRGVTCIVYTTQKDVPCNTKRRRMPSYLCQSLDNPVAMDLQLRTSTFR